MLQLSNAYTDKKILSLHNGAVIGKALQPLINPENLHIEGWYCEDAYSGSETILLVQDVREYTRDGVIVNSHEALTDTEDLIRLKKTIQIRFDLIGKKVRTENKTKVGTISDYAVDSSSMYINKLYVDPPVLKSLSFNHEQRIIDRSAIVEITDQEIIIRDSSVRSGIFDTAPLQA